MSAHRSFRLTLAAARGQVRRGILTAPLVQQLLVLGVSSFALDGGLMFRMFGCVALAYWLLVAAIMMRRRSRLTPADRMLILVWSVQQNVPYEMRHFLQGQGARKELVGTND